MDPGAETAAAPARRRALWMLLAVGLIAIAGGAAGAYFGLHAARGSAAGAGAEPSPRAYAAVAYDEAPHQVVVFGGLGAGGATLGDTWTWDGTTWTQQHPSISPPARAYALMTYDPRAHDVVLVGGRASSTSAPVPCAASGSASANAVPPVAPISPRATVVSPPPPVVTTPTATQLPAPVPPATRGAAPCLGTAMPPLVSDTWTWDGSGWHSTGASLPTGLVSDTPALATDPTTGQVMLLAQTAPEPLPLHACPVPSPGAPPSACPAPVGSSIRAWTWNGSGWEREAGSLPTPQSVLTVGGAGALVADPTSGHLTSFRGGAAVVCAEAPAGGGGAAMPCPLNASGPPASSVPGSPPQIPGAPAPSATAPSVVPSPKPTLPFMQTGSATRWDGHAWSQPQPLEPSPSIFGTSFAGDTARHSVVAYGGGTTWRWSGSSWTALQPSHTPGDVVGAAMVYDGSSGRVLLFGGAATGPGSSTPAYTNALWAWDGATWSQIGAAQPSPSASPSPSTSPSPAPTGKPDSSPTPTGHPVPSPCADLGGNATSGPNRPPASASASPSVVPSCTP